MILIALVALIIFGPRKLPTIGRTIGKYTAEFKRASREFRDTFEREVQMAELEEKQASSTSIAKNVETTTDFNQVENTIGQSSPFRAQTTQSENAVTPITENNSIAPPEIRPVNQADFAAQTTNSNPIETAPVAEVVENTLPRSKREWL